MIAEKRLVNITSIVYLLHKSILTKFYHLTDIVDIKLIICYENFIRLMLIFVGEVLIKEHSSIIFLTVSLSFRCFTVSKNRNQLKY